LSGHFRTYRYQDRWDVFHLDFQRNRDDVRRLGYDEEFIRRWEFFLAGWYAMFKSGRYNVMQAKVVHYP